MAAQFSRAMAAPIAFFELEYADRVLVCIRLHICVRSLLASVIDAGHSVEDLKSMAASVVALEDAGQRGCAPLVKPGNEIARSELPLKRKMVGRSRNQKNRSR